MNLFLPQVVNLFFTSLFDFQCGLLGDAIDDTQPQYVLSSNDETGENDQVSPDSFSELVKLIILAIMV